MRRHDGGRLASARSPRGSGLIGILIVLVVLAILVPLLYKSLMAPKKIEGVNAERPLSAAKLTADQATLTAIRAELNAHYAANGQWPADKAAALAALSTPPRFQCPGNDFEYDPATGAVRLVVDDPMRC